MTEILYLNNLKSDCLKEGGMTLSKPLGCIQSIHVCAKIYWLWRTNTTREAEIER
jgi:hypothetical protein